MTSIEPYKTYLNYENASGIYKILYPVRDAIPVMNPFFVILLGFMLIATVGSYFVYFRLSGLSRFFNSLLARTYVTFLVSVIFAMRVHVTPYVVLLFIGITVLS